MLPLSEPSGMVMPAAIQSTLIGIFAALIVASLVWGLLRLVREQDPRLLILVLAGMAATLLEGFACMLIRVHYADLGNIVLYRAFGINVALWLGQIYVVFFGVFAFIFGRAFLRAPSTRLFWGTFAVIGIGEGLFEIWVAKVGLLTYWGVQGFPIGGFPAQLGFVNPALALAFTAFAAYWFRMIEGPSRWLLVPTTIPFMVGVYAAMVMPAAAGLFADELALARIGAGLTILIALVVAALSCRVLLYLAASEESVATTPHAARTAGLQSSNRSMR